MAFTAAEETVLRAISVVINEEFEGDVSLFREFVSTGALTAKVALKEAEQEKVKAAKAAEVSARDTQISTLTSEIDDLKGQIEAKAPAPPPSS